jgi:transcription factor SPT20
MSGPVAVARPSQPPRLRRESQRPGVARTVTRQSNMEDESAKQEARKYGMPKCGQYIAHALTLHAVYTQQDILAKHKGKPPSLRVYLHPKHFRLNDSQETLSYASPMRELLQAIKDKEVPHNMVEELYEFNTPWYDDCLIVEVHDYRSAGVKPKDDTNSTGEAGTSAFSIHNYNSFITPSPFAPFPAKQTDSKATQANAQSKEGEPKEDKENMPAPGQNGALNKQPGIGKVRTVVLFPTQQSRLADMQLLATTPVPDMATLKRMQAQGRAGGMPPTPMTAVPSTPTFPNGPSPKRQKMVLDDTNVHEFEAEFLNATCPPLYLEPTKSFGQSLALMDAITHPNNKNPAPPRKTRKRTTAELAADEAEAQGLQRFMLAGDEFQSNMTATAAGNDDNAVRAAANSQTFARFKTIANIRANHEEADRRKKEEDARIAQAKRQAQMEAELQRKREMESRQQAEVAERQQQQALRQQAHQAQLQQSQQQQNDALRAAAAAQHQMSNAAAIQATQTPQSATQSQFSPTIRQQTPMAAAAASPSLGAQAAHQLGGTPMVPTASNQAINSPARPPSAVSNHQNMMRSVSQQQNLSRTGTPHIVQGTPVMNASMPNRNMTPTPSRMGQGSPSMSMQGQTPMMMQTPQPGQSMTPEQVQQIQQQRLQQQLRMQQIQQQAGSPGNQQQQFQQIAFQKAAQQIQTQGVPQGQNPQAYRQQLAQHYFRQLTQNHQQNQQQLAMQTMSPGGGMPQNNMPAQGMTFANLNLQQMRARYQNHKQTVMQNYGQNIPPQVMQQIQQMELQIKSREQREQQQMQMAHMQSNMGGQMNNGQMNGMQNGNSPNPMQMQQYQQMLQQQRQHAANNNRLLQMRQQAMASGGQLPQGMMGNMNAMNNMQGGGMQGMNMGNMSNMGNMGQGMNMAQMGQMNGGMGNMQGGQMNGGMQGMQGMQGMNQQQMNQMMMMRQAQQQAQRMGQQGGQQGGDMSWTG